MKKENAKQKRMRVEAERKSHYQKENLLRDIEKKQAEELKKADCEIKKKAVEAEQENAARIVEKELFQKFLKYDKRTKSSAKAAGLKSTFIINNDRALVTSFDSGARARRESYIEDSGEKAVSVCIDSILTIIPKGKKFEVSGRTGQKTDVDYPLHTSSTQDVSGAEKKKLISGSGRNMIYCKENWEKIYFSGHTYEDNIHIQLIYSIMDIEKELAVYVNNIIFTINNLLRRNYSEHDDIIASMSLTRESKNAYEKFKSKEIPYKKFQTLVSQPQFAYFGTEFVKPIVAEPDDEDSKQELQDHEEKMFFLLSTLGQIRQATAHGTGETRGSLYIMGHSTSDKMQQARFKLDDMYKKQIKSLNKNFFENSKKDINYLTTYIYPNIDEKQRIELQKKYYAFIVRKEYKNLGFSIKQLREELLKNDAQELKDCRYDTVRSKINHLLDFVITSYYLNEENADHVCELVCDLRASKNEVEKALIYSKEAKILYNKIKEQIKCIEAINGDFFINIEQYNRIKKKQGGREETSKDKIVRILNKDIGNEEELAEVLVPENANFFCEMVYLLTIFLDGKEINELLTTLINSFENIGSFLDVMAAENMDCSFSDNFKQFFTSQNIKQVIGELRVINNIAQMKKPDSDSKKDEDKKKEKIKMKMMEAAWILGYDQDVPSLNQYVDAVLSKDLEKQKMQHISDLGFRNFIINNVIKSTRFHYLVRYANPRKVRKIAQNKNIVRYVLQDGIPENQILRYYNSCNGKDETEFREEMRDDLLEKITNVNFKNYANIRIEKRKKYYSEEDKKEIEFKEKSKNIVRLYLTVLYLVFKNLVNINSRYYMAFHCLERDYMAYNYGSDVSPNVEKLKADYSLFANQFLDEHRECYKGQSHKEFSNRVVSDPWAIRAYRNCCEHLTAVRNAEDFIGEEDHTNDEKLLEILSKYKNEKGEIPDNIAQIKPLRKVSSYYALYHYLVQRTLVNQFIYDSSCNAKDSQGNILDHMIAENVNHKIVQFMDLTCGYGSYCKDLVKALNVAFLYNLPRYKNLSVKELFDKNDYTPNKYKEEDYLNLHYRFSDI